MLLTTHVSSHCIAITASRSAEDEPCVCQLGGSSPEHLAQASRIVEEYGYNDVNLNVRGDSHVSPRRPTASGPPATGRTC